MASRSQASAGHFSPAFILTWLSLALAAPAKGIELQSLGFPGPKECHAELSNVTHPACPGVLVPIQAPGHAEQPMDIGQWRLVRTPGPVNGRDVVSIMRTADELRSDPDFAGLMIRCREKSSLQIGLVVVRPFPPRAHPQVTVISGHTRTQLQASVLPGGIILSLPNESEVLAKGPWQSLDQVSFAIQGDGDTINGIVPLGKLSAALAYLQSNCTEQ